MGIYDDVISEFYEDKKPGYCYRCMSYCCIHNNEELKREAEENERKWREEIKKRNEVFSQKRAEDARNEAAGKEIVRSILDFYNVKRDKDWPTEIICDNNDTFYISELFGLKNPHDFYISVGSGKISADDIVKKLKQRIGDFNMKHNNKLTKFNDMFAKTVSVVNNAADVNKERHMLEDLLELNRTMKKIESDSEYNKCVADMYESWEAFLTAYDKCNTALKTALDKSRS